MQEKIPERIIRRRQLEELVGLEYTAIWRRMRAGEFPRPVQLGVRAVGWKLSEVQAWIDGRPLANQPADAGTETAA